MRKLIITLQTISIITLLLVAIGNAFSHDYGNAGVAFLAAVLMGRC
jgi:hypothetical protein